MMTDTPSLKWARYFVFGLILILPLEGTAALRNILWVFALACCLPNTKQILKFAPMPLPLPWAIYACVAAFGLIWAVDPRYSAGEIYKEIFIPITYLWLGYILFSDQQKFRRFVEVAAVGAVFLVGYSLWALATNQYTKDVYVGTYQTGVGNYTTYLITLLPLLVWGCVQEKLRIDSRWRFVLALGILVAIAISLFGVKNRISAVCVLVEVLAAGILCARYLSRKQLFIIVVAGLCFSFALYYIQATTREAVAQVENVANVYAYLNSTADGRMAGWRFAVGNVFESPWVGSGLGKNVFRMAYPEYTVNHGIFVHAHNMLVNRGVQLGIPGVLAFLFLYFAFVVRYCRGFRYSPLARGLGVVGIAMAFGVFSKNMTDDFFNRELGYFFWLISGAILSAQKGSRLMAKADPKNILIVRRDNIGDLLCSTPMIRGLRLRYPQARIDALVNSYNQPVLAGNPDLNHVYAYTKAKHRSPGETVLGVHFRRLSLMWQLRRVAYDVVMLAGDGNINRQLSLSRWLAAGQVIGFAPEDGTTPPGLDTPVPRPVTGHEAERTFALLAPLGIIGTPPEMVLVPDAELAKQGRQLLDAAHPLVAGGHTVAIHISARKIPQRWPVEMFAELMRQIHQQEGSRFVLFWSPGDENNALHPGDDGKAAKLLGLVTDLPVQAYPTHHLSELIAGLSLCDRMVCADGGAMHIGAALGLPMVCLFGNSDVARWYPWGNVNHVLQAPSRDVADLPVALVLEKYNLLAGCSGNDMSCDGV